MSLVLCALTGFGNAVLERLVTIGQAPKLLVTRAEAGQFPHYDLENITAAAARYDVPVLFGAEGEAAIRDMRPDLLFCTTYHRILNAETRAAAGHAINFHPSLLPRYRGPNPFYWVIRRGEIVTGITAHRLEAQADAGAICWTGKITLAADETQGSLRRRLAYLAADGAEAVLGQLAASCLSWVDQDDTLAEWQDKPDAAEIRIDISQSLVEIERQIRALLPYPGVRFAGYDVKSLSIDFQGGDAIGNQMAKIILGNQSLAFRFWSLD